MCHLIAGCGQLVEREVLIGTSGFLQKQDRGLKLFQPVEHLTDPRSDGVDVPGGYPHSSGQQPSRRFYDHLDGKGLDLRRQGLVWDLLIVAVHDGAPDAASPLKGGWRAASGSV